MRHAISLMMLTLALTAPAAAESLMDKVKKGADTALDAATKGAESAADLAAKGAEAVGQSLSDTQELMRDEETPDQTRAKLDTMANEVLSRLLAENELARETFMQSAGYAAFDMRRISVFPLSAGYGRGVAVSGTGEGRTYMQMGTGGVGAAFGIGGFESQFVILFETPADFSRFVEKGYDASADAGLMKGDERTTETVQFTQGQSFFVLDRTGWRVNANASGTRYWPDADLN